MAQNLDIHEYQKIYESLLKRIKRKSISNENKNLILEYDKIRALEGIALSTRIRNIECLLDFAQAEGNISVIDNEIIRLDIKKIIMPDEITMSVVKKVGTNLIELVM